MVMVLPLILPETPVGKFVKLAPVAPDIWYPMVVRVELTHNCWLIEASEVVRKMVLLGLTTNTDCVAD